MGHRQRTILLLLLVGVNAILAAGPIVATSLPTLVGRLDIGILSWTVSALTALSTPPFLLLVVWCGLGTSRISVRVVGGIIGLLYLAATRLVLHWAALQILARAAINGYDSPEEIPTYLETFIRSAALNSVLFAIWLSPLLAYRTHVAALRLTHEANSEPSIRPQLNLASLFLLTLIVAMFLGLGRVAQLPPGPQGFDLVGIAQQGLYTLTFGLIAYWGLRAATLPGGWRLRVVSTLAFAVFPLGIAYGSCLSWARIEWSEPDGLLRLLTWTLVVVVMPTVVYVASLLLVRYCGYRLVRHGD